MSDPGAYWDCSFDDDGSFSISHSEQRDGDTVRWALSFGHDGYIVATEVYASGKTGAARRLHISEVAQVGDGHIKRIAR